MDYLLNIKAYSQEPQELVIFVPPKITIPPSCSTLLKRLCVLVKEFRKALTPCIYTTCVTLAVVILVFFQGLFIFLLLLLDITIQDTFVSLDCWNTSRTGQLTSTQAAAWSDSAFDLKRPLQVVSTILITLFLLESALRIFLSGRRIIHHYWEILDSLIILISFGLTISTLVDFTTGKQVGQFIILFRLWRTLELFSGVSFSAQATACTPSQYAPAGNPHLRPQTSSSSTGPIMSEPSAYVVCEQNVATLMLRIEELEQQICQLQREIPAGNCRQCLNHHNWTTEDLLQIACLELSRSDSRGREELRGAKSLEDLSLPESGYSSAQRKLRGGGGAGYPALIYRLSDRIQQEQMKQRPLQTAVDIEGILLRQVSGAEARESVSELSEIKRIAQIEFRPDSTLHDVPVTTL